MKPNQSGAATEANVAAVLSNAGVTFTSQTVLGRTIYGSELRVDFVARNLKRYPNGVVIESKWQDCAGTADEKFPYLVENIRSCYPLPAIVVAHGGGCRPGALAWLRAQRDGLKLVEVFNMEELTSWLLRAEKRPIPRLFNP